MFDKTTNRHRGKREQELRRRIVWQLLHVSTAQITASVMTRCLNPVVLNPSVLQVLQRRGCLARNAMCPVDLLIRVDFSGQSNDISLGGPLLGSVPWWLSLG